MAYPYDDMPPGYGPQGYGQPGMYGQAAPGMFGVGMGMSSGDLMQQQQAIQAGGAMMGSGVVSALSGVPAALGMGISAASMVSPMAMAGMQNPGLLQAGYRGIFATGSMGRALGYGAAKTIDMMDPSSHVMRFGGAGMRMGGGMGRALGGLAMRMAPTGASMLAAPTGAAAMGASGIGLMGAGLGALAGAAIPVGAGLAAYQGLEYAGQQMYQGMADTMHGQALMNQLGGSVAPGQSMRGQGAATGRMMRDMAGDLGTDMEDISRYAQQLNSQKVFQTSRSAKEFRDKFKEVMGAVKDIAKIAQGSVDDAMKMFTDLRQQGFYTTADIKSQAASRQAREMTTGISAGVYSAIGGAGAQVARQYGMRGRFGARMAESNVAGVAMGVRSGAMSEEEVEELGGVEAVGMRMAQHQMSFLKSARGRAMIAYSMGEGGAPDPQRLNRLLRGTSMEDIVTGAAGRGLGVLQAAGGREAREQFAPYAGMAMVQMAASQQRQLYGSVSERGILGMMGTMGVGREEAQLMLQQTMQMPKQLQAEQNAREQQAERAQYESMRSVQSYMGRASAALDRQVGSRLRGVGASIGASVAGGYSRAMEGLVGGVEYAGGDLGLARQYAAGGDQTTLLGGGVERSPIFGLTSASGRLGSQYADAMLNRVEAQQAVGGDLDKALKDGTVVQLGGGKYAMRSRIAQADRAMEKGAREGLSDTEILRLRSSVSRGDYMERLDRAREDERQRMWKATGGVAGTKEGGDAYNRLAKQLKSDDFGAFFAAQEAGAVTKDLTFQEFMQKPMTERLELQAKSQSGLQRAAAEGGYASERIRLSAGAQKEGGLLSARDLQSTREQFGNVLNQYLHGEAAAAAGGGVFAKIGAALGYLTGGSMQSAFAQKLTTSGKTRQAFSNYMRLLASTDSEGKLSDADLKELMGYESQLRDELSDDEFANVQKLKRDAMDDPKIRENFKKTWSNGGDGQKLMAEYAYKEHVAKSAKQLTAAADRLLTAEGGVPGDMRAAVARIRGASGDLSDAGLAQRRVAMDELVSGAIKGEGGLTGEELEVFTALGGEQGAAIGTAVQALQKGDVKGAGALKGYIGGGELERIAKMSDPEKQADAIAAALKKAGLTDLGLGLGADKKSIQGVQSQYIETNAQFVQSVHAFVSALSAAGVKGVPDIAGPANALVEAGGGEATGGGNS